MTVVEYDGRIVVVDCGLRFPTAEMMGIDLVLPDFTYLREHVDDDRGDRHHARPRGPPRRAAVGDPRPRPGQDPGRLRRPADDRDGALQARRAQAARRQPRGAADRRHGARPARSRSSASTSRTRSRTRAASRSRRRSAPCSSPATTSSTRRRSAARPPTWRGWPSSAARACCCCAATRRTSTARASRTSESIVGPHLDRVFAPLQGPHRRHLLRLEHPPRPAGRRTRPRRTAARSRSSAARCARTSTSAAALGHIDIPEGMLRPAARDRPVGRREDRRHLHRLPGRAAVGAAPDGLPRPPAGRAASAATPWSSRATPIPGNERAVNETIDRLYHIGCEVVTARDAPIHASGHGYAEEVKMMINLTRPKYVMPVHGDFKRMLIHCRARRGGRRPAREHLPHRERHAAGDRRRRRALRRARCTAGMIFVDGVDIGDVADVALRDRRMLSRRRHLHHRRDGLRAGRLVGRPARGARPRRARSSTATARSSTSCARRSRTRSTAPPSSTITEIDVLRVASCTTTSRRSSTTGSSAARWCCRSSSRSDAGGAGSAPPPAGARVRTPRGTPSSPRTRRAAPRNSSASRKAAVGLAAPDLREGCVGRAGRASPALSP